MIGAIIIFMLTNGLVRMGVPGYVTSAITGVILLVAVGIDVEMGEESRQGDPEDLCQSGARAAVARALDRTATAVRRRSERPAG